MEGLVDTKNEYITHLCDLLVPYIAKSFLKIYDQTKNLKAFQSKLIKIKTWNASLVEEEYNAFQKNTNCSYLYKLVKAIIMTSIKIKLFEHKQNIKKIKMKVPSVETFYHKCLQQCALIFWKHPYLFYINLKPIERQHNLNQIESYINKAIKKTFVSILPINDIIEQLDETVNNLVDDDESDEYEDDDVEEEDEDVEDDDEDEDVEEEDEDVEDGDEEDEDVEEEDEDEDEDVEDDDDDEEDEDDEDDDEEDDNQEVIEDKDEEVIKENQEVIEEKQEVIEEKQEVIKENQEVIKENQEVIEEKQEVIKENQEVIEEKQEVIKENQEVIEEKQEVIEEKQIEEKQIEEKQEVMENIKEIILKDSKVSDAFF